MSIPSWAYVGAKIVCVGDLWTCSPNDADLPDPIVGEVYEIAHVEDRCFGTDPDVWLCGFEDDFAYGLSNFRPLVTIEDDIATHFSQHLNSRQPRKTGVDV
jgi:hypothetical protein